ncbi:MAG TPA: hypothetical protein VLW17_10465 [Thermoanaerobaculaceae bacterium]|nr:hypothetical protein [Thermoanaerobaculaceae bacterium]
MSQSLRLFITPVICVYLERPLEKLGRRQPAAGRQAEPAVFPAT